MHRTPLALLLLALSSTIVGAEMPSGHPTVPETGQASEEATALPNKGKVLEVIDSGGYTYLRVSDGGKETWVAVNSTAVKVEDFVHYSKGNLMTNFHSKTLDRTFDKILFAANLQVEGSHPTVEQAAEILNIDTASTQLPNEGRVVSTIPSNAYTYIEVESEGKTQWLAVPRVELANGTHIRYGEGAVMKNFYSKKLGRDFEEVIFLGGVLVVQ